MYKEFLETTHTKHDPNYYLKLVKYTKDILLDISMRNQFLVARDLNITPVKLSHLLPLLKALLFEEEQKLLVEEEEKGND